MKIIALSVALLLCGCASQSASQASGFCITSSLPASTIIGCNREKGSSPGTINVTCGQNTISCTDTQPAQRITVPAIVPVATPTVPGPVPK